MTLSLRPYQTEANASVVDAWRDGPDRPAVVLPTGAGKTVVFSNLAYAAYREGLRPLILVHRDELATQTATQLELAGFPATKIGVVKAERDEHDRDVVIASIQTLFRQNRLANVVANRHEVVIVDEVHHYAADVYRRVLTELGVFDGVPSVGYTATFTRHDSRKLANDWTPVVEKTMAWAIEHGYLTPLDSVMVRVPDLELDAVSTHHGDFADGSLGTAMINSSASDIIPEAWQRYAVDETGRHRPTIMFAPTIESCDELADGFHRAGVKCETVYGTTPRDERQAIYDRVRTGVTPILASVGVLTEGFDMPEVSCAIMARPTESRGLFQQMVGRIVRLFPGKDDALLLDVIGNTARHTLVDLTDLTTTYEEEVTEEDSAPAACGCVGACCGAELRGDCTRNKNLGLCLCGECDCPTKGERSSIHLVKGAGDVHVDLFRGSTSVWLRTRAGHWFIPTRDCLVVVKQTADGAWRAARTHDGYNAAGQRAAWVSGPADISTAMSVAAMVAMTLDSSVATKTAKWRSGKASPAQTELAAKLGLDVDGMRRGPVSDALSIHYASRALDR